MAVRMRGLPSQWAGEDLRDLVTVLDLLDEADRHGGPAEDE